MLKMEIATRIHQEAGISEEEAASLMNWILELFKSILQKGEPISIFNFGVLTVRNRPSRKGRNPQTGGEIMIPPRRVVTFRASPHLKAEVDSIQAEEQEAEALLPKGN